jgi:hypothetical protein
LVEELCLRLREIGVYDALTTTSERGRNLLAQVQVLLEELDRRDVDLTERMRRLSAETGWDMVSLLDDCRGSPAIRPYLREADGIRRAFRCSACKRAERPEDDTTFFLCDSCLRVMLDALRAHRGSPEHAPVPDVHADRTVSACERRHPARRLSVVRRLQRVRRRILRAVRAE